MRRKIFDDSTETTEINKDELSDLVADYIDNKSLEAKYKNLAASGNTKIKQIMTSKHLTSASCSTGTVTLSERKSESFNEDELIEFLMSKGHEGDIVKTKRYVDYDALESAIYHEKLSEDDVKELDRYRDTKITYVLNIKKGD